MSSICLLFIHLYFLAAVVPTWSQRGTVGRFQEVFAWTQMTYNIDGNIVLRDRFGEVDGDRRKRDNDAVVFNDGDDKEGIWNRPFGQGSQYGRPQWSTTSTTDGPQSTTTVNPSDERGNFFIQYNNVPMGVEKVGNRLFITMPRRRYGIPATLNYLDLTTDSNTRSPALRPYPTLREARTLISVYRTRADECQRLWMVDTGMIEIPNDRQQLQPPAIVVYDLRTDRQILRYPLKDTDLAGPNTPTGLASITIDVENGNCSNTFAYIPDLTTYGLIVFSLTERDSWRLSHNYFSYEPTAGNLEIGGHRFQWNDGIFSVALSNQNPDGCKIAYFHAMVGTHEFSVSTCVLKNRTASDDANFWTFFAEVGDRGPNSQSTMHGYHPSTKTMFFANIVRDGVLCWNTGKTLTPSSIEILARDSVRMSYPSDLHVTGDEVWLMANRLPTFAYSRLNTEEYNFFVYKANVRDLIYGTVCAPDGNTVNFL